ncbi:Arm DNA-binding domain-containing protein [Sphingopyxis indica]|uniref:Arm DNA-binding domain-containing protein n=1 Tax=Sphingopyxis indica TaxID=436663 RepID=UPI0037430AA7
MTKLTALAVKAGLANPGTYQDGDGLFLKVDKRGGAYWLLRPQRDGKRHDIGLGSAKLLPLSAGIARPLAEPLGHPVLNLRSRHATHRRVSASSLSAREISTAKLTGRSPVSTAASSRSSPRSSSVRTRPTHDTGALDLYHPRPAMHMSALAIFAPKAARPQPANSHRGFRIGGVSGASWYHGVQSTKGHGIYSTLQLAI